MKTQKAVLISACLLGEPCRFDGKGKEREELLSMLEGSELIPFCPEVEGGLPTPRPAAEMTPDGVFRKDGLDVTQYFHRGAKLGVSLARDSHISLAVLKSRSPSCGCGEVYDGTFSKTLMKGDGIFTQALKANGVDCISDEQYLQNSKDIS